MKKNDVLHSHFMRALLKWFIMVKLIWVIIVASVLQVSAGTNESYSQTVKLDLRLNNVDLEQVIWAIKKQTDFKFFYSSEEVGKVKDLDVDVKNATPEDVLNDCLAGTDLTYEIVHKAVIIKALPAEKSKNSLPAVEQPQKKELKGTVTDAKGGPIPGASVMIKGQAIGTVTASDGSFMLSVPVDAKTLVFSFIGFSSREVLIGNQTNFQIILEDQTIGVEEVVVVGYGAQKKESVIGAIAQVKGADLVKSGTPSVANSLTGRVPGMVTIQQSGMPGGDDSKIYIRGLSSFAGNNQPLVMVDGIERGMNDIDASDIESISVLKDASATAVYGVKGGNGVILITTKRGETGRMSIEASYEHTLKAPTSQGVQENSYNTLNARDQMYRYRDEYSKVLGNDILEHYRIQDMPYIYPDVDAWDYTMRKFTTDYKASVAARGGTENAKYYISLGILHEGDLLKDQTDLYDPSYKYNRANFRMNFDFNLTKSTKFSISSSGFVGVQNFGGRDDQGDQGGIINQVFTTPPYMSPYVYPASLLEQYPDDRNPEISDRWASNLLDPASPLAVFRHNAKGTVQNTRDRLATDLILEQKLDVIAKGLSFKALFSYNNETAWNGGGYTYNGDQYTLRLIGNQGAYEWYRTNDYFVVPPPYQTPLSRSGNPTYNYVYSGQLNFARTFGNHAVTGLGLFERRIGQLGAGFPHYEEKWSGRATYSYDERYLVEATFGVSGSEQFAPANRFGYFPSLAIGWNIAKESFVKQLVPEMNNLKLRYSYGESGNDGTSNWLYISEYTNWSSFKTGIPGSQKDVVTTKEGTVPNMNAQWERAKKHNLGIDLGLFKNTLTFSAEFYDEERTGILMGRRAVASWFGQGLKSLNIGETKRHGYEFEAGYNKTVGDFNYWAKFNFNFNENRIVKRDDPLMTPEYQKTEGKPISVSYSSLNIGYYQDADEIANYSLNQTTLKTIGADKVLDFNGDATTANDGVPMGYSTRPNKTFGLNSGLIYRQFDFSFLIQGTAEVERNFGGAANPLWSNSPNEFYVKFEGRDDLWSPANRDAKYAAWGAWNPANKATFDASYLRLKSVELGYTFSGNLLNAIGLSSARFSISGSNLYTYAPDFVLGDPENETNGENGNDYLFQSYPIPKRITAAIKVNF